jgi:hypothetical protein
MQIRRHLPIAALLCLLGALAARGADRDYLIVSPKAWTAALEPLIRLRTADGYRVTVLTTDALAGEDRRVSSSLLRARIAKDRPAVVLLVGDTPASMEPGPMRAVAVPTCTVEGSSYGGHTQVATDVAYTVFRKATDEPTREASHVPAIQIGRLSVKSRDALEKVVARIVTAQKPADLGPWRRRIHLIGSAPNYSKRIDALIDRLATQVIDQVIPPQYTISMTYGRASSLYCWPPPRFADQAVRRFNEGCLIYGFLGHATFQRTARVRDPLLKKRFPVLDAEVVRRFAAPAGTATVCLLVTCDTGRLDDGSDCLAEMLFRQDRGPVAVIASSRFSLPYGNAVFGKQFVEAVCTHHKPTVGEAMLHAQRTLLARPDPNDRLRKLIDDTAKELRESLVRPAERIKHVYLYHLFGDPAMPIPHPPQRLVVQATGDAAPGAALNVTARSPAATGIHGTARVTVEIPRTVNPFPRLALPDDPAGRDRAMEANYRNAHHKVVARASVPVAGDLRTTIRLPVDSPMFGAADVFYVKVYVTGRTTAAFGCAQIRARSPGK